MRDTIRRRRADFEAAAAARLKEITIPDPSESSESDGSPATPTSSRSISPEPEPEEAPSRRRRAPVSDPSDYWDPRNLPTKHVQRRTTKQVKQLDIAVFNSAVQDVLVQDKWDLGRVLVEWDAIKIKRQEEESGNEVAATPAPVTISSDSDDDDEEEEEEEEEGEEAYETAAPSTPSPFKPSVQRSIPTSNFVSSMARWPLARTDLPPSQFLFAEELSALVSKNIRRLSSSSAHAPSPKTRKRKKTQSAYSQAGPLCSSGEIDSDETSSDEGSEENLGSDDDDLAPGDRLPEHQKLIARLSDAADDVLSSLAALVPPGPLPPQTLWEQTRRDNQNIKHDDKGLGFGWEMVVAVVKQSGKVPEGVVKVLQKRLEMIYGESGPKISLVKPF